MGTLTDIHGKQYHLETWYADAHTSLENSKIREAQGLIPHLRMKKVVVDETRELITGPIDLGGSIVTPQADGRYTWKKKETSN